jgi:HD-GYP domain-containing protein (c-di-GMP phosphodiesterase class II)
MRILEPKPESRRRSLEEQARALALVLREEFGVPFTLFDVRTGAEVRTAREAGRDDPDVVLGSRMELPAVKQLAIEGRARAMPLPGGRYQVALLLYEANRPSLMAAGEVSGLARTPTDSRREQQHLEKWAQAVSDRLRLAEQSAKAPRREEQAALPAGQNTTPWETLLALDHLTRRLRLHKDSTTNFKRILESAFNFLGAQSLAWVSRNPEEAVLFHGENCANPSDCRLLAGQLAKSPDYRPPAPIFVDKFQKLPESTRFPLVHNLLALPVTNQGLAGWVIAFNKRNDDALPPPSPEERLTRTPPPYSPFRKSDAALLTPFVALLELTVRGATRYREIKDLLVGLTRSLTTAIDAKDTYTYGHSERVARIAVELGRELDLDADDLGDIYLTGLLHDVGKIGIRDEVLRKPGKLTPEEQDHIRQHVTIGYSILAELRQIRNLLPGVLYHHERYDGKGYPDGLAGENIPLLARILAVADAYDAMTTARPYRDPMPWRKVEEILADGAGTQWDRRVVEAFQRCRQKIHTIRQRGVGESLRHAIEGALRNDADSHHGFAPSPPGKTTGP